MMLHLLAVTITLHVPFTEREQRIIKRMSPVPALPQDLTNRVADDPRAADLGIHLFKIPDFSASGAVGCVTCHMPGNGFDDGRPVAKGEAEGTRNAPTLIGAAYQRWFFWDGRADSLWAQALHPFENPGEFNGTRNDAVRTVFETPYLRRDYDAVFGTLPPMSDTTRFPVGGKPGTAAWKSMTESDRHAVTTAFVNLGKSIAAYERTIPIGTSRFDRWVAALGSGDGSLLTDQEQRGLHLFMGDAGCRNCHSGPLFTDRAFHNIGLPEADGSFPADPGRSAGLQKARAHEFRLSGRWSDDPDGPQARRADQAKAGPEHWGAFRTPTLRNLAATGPYMHDGRFASLSDVLAFYNTLEDQVRLDHHQEQVLKPLDLSKEDLAALEAFLGTLQDEPETPEESS